MKETIEKEIRGEEFKITVLEHSPDERTVKVRHSSDEYTRCYDRRKTTYGIFRSYPIAPREEHIMDAVSKGVSDYFEEENKKEEMRETMEAVADAAQEVYGEELRPEDL